MSLASLQRRRDQERILDQTKSFLQDQHNTERILSWENRTQKAIERREVDDITQQLLQQDEEALSDRKHDLQSLYNGEKQNWKQTLQTSLEVTQEERMEQIRRRAYELKNKREKERQAFVAECYERQWKNACEELREYESKATLDRLTKDRAAMIENKQKILAAEAEQEQQSAKNGETTDAMTLIPKDEALEQAQMQQSSLEFKQSLDHQVLMKQEKDKRVTMQAQLEEQEQLRQLAILETTTKKEEEVAIEESRRSGAKTLKANRVRAKERKENEMEERRQNLVLLQHAMELERQQISRENALKDSGKEAAAEYVHSLKEQAKEDEKENEHANRIRKNEQDRIVKLADDKLNAQAEQRRIWQQEVDVSRKEQIHHRRQQEELARREEDHEVSQAAAALCQAEEADIRDAEIAHKQRMEVYEENKLVILSMAMVKDQNKLEKLEEQEEIKKQESDYQKRMDRHKKQSHGVGDLI